MFGLSLKNGIATHNPEVVGSNPTPAIVDAVDPLREATVSLSHRCVVTCKTPAVETNESLLWVFSWW